MHHSSFNSSSQSKDPPSGSLEPSAFYSSQVPSDRKSEGNIPIPVSKRSDKRDREATLMPEFSEYGSIALTSGLILPEVSCCGIPSWL